METAYAWPGYLDERRWKRLSRAGFAGPAKDSSELPSDDGSEVLPRRPTGAGANEIVYRESLFERFHGFLTYGSPLAKFSAIRPALVPISRQRAFRPDTPWINIYDPIDPVSGRLFAFARQPVQVCPHPTDLGYAAGWLLLLAHLNYFTRREGHTDAATCTGAFPAGHSALRGARPGCPAKAETARFGWRSGDWFGDKTGTRWTRTFIAFGSWIIAAAVLACLGAIILPLLVKAALAAIGAIWSHASPPTVEMARPQAGSTFLGSVVDWVGAEIASVADWIKREGHDFHSRVGLLIAFAALFTLLAGMVSRIPIFFARDRDDIISRKPWQANPSTGAATHR
jgi:hypothetical protein